MSHRVPGHRHRDTGTPGTGTGTGIGTGTGRTRQRRERVSTLDFTFYDSIIPNVKTSVPMLSLFACLGTTL